MQLVNRNALAGERGREHAPCGHPVPCGCDKDAVPVVETCCDRCWLPDCRNALPGGLRMLRRRVRDERIRALGDRYSPAQLAARFDVAPRSIYRILEESSDAAQP